MKLAAVFAYAVCCMVTVNSSVATSLTGNGNGANGNGNAGGNGNGNGGKPDLSFE